MILSLTKFLLLCLDTEPKSSRQETEKRDKVSHNFESSPRGYIIPLNEIRKADMQINTILNYNQQHPDLYKIVLALRSKRVVT